MLSGHEDLGAVVVDIGSYTSRVGFAGEDSPKGLFPSSVGVQFDESTTKGQISYHFDEKYRPNMSMSSPVVDGVITDWDLLEALWDYSIPTMLKMDSVNNVPVLVAEKPYTSLASRQR